jgi:hypothetical protein
VSASLRRSVVEKAPGRGDAPLWLAPALGACLVRVQGTEFQPPRANTESAQFRLLASRSSGCFSKTSLILSRRRPFSRRNVSGSADAGVVAANLSGVAAGLGGGCSSELGFCGMSGKSGGRVGGLTGGGSGWGNVVVWFGHGVSPRDVRLNHGRTSFVPASFYGVRAPPREGSEVLRSDFVVSGKRRRRRDCHFIRKPMVRGDAALASTVASF